MTKPGTTQAPRQELIQKPPPQDQSGFESRGLVARADAKDPGALAAVAREEGEIKAAVAMAKMNPRDELVAFNKLMKSCGRAAFSRTAMYHFPRGNQQIEGPSVDLAREAARCWGNIRYGLRIVSDDDDTVHIQGVAIDLESNNSVCAEDKFKKLVQRKIDGITQWIKPDERDLRELVNRRGAICVRNALLQLLPPDIIDEAMAATKDTNRKAAAGDLAKDRNTVIRGLVAAFSEIGVSPQMLEERLGHELTLVNEQEVAELRGIWKSISDGNSKRDEYFTFKKKGAESGTIDMAAIGEKKPEKPKE